MSDFTRVNKMESFTLPHSLVIGRNRKYWVLWPASSSSARSFTLFATWNFAGILCSSSLSSHFAHIMSSCFANNGRCWYKSNFRRILILPKGGENYLIYTFHTFVVLNYDDLSRYSRLCDLYVIFLKTICCVFRTRHCCFELRHLAVVISLHFQVWPVWGRLCAIFSL